MNWKAFFHGNTAGRASEPVLPVRPSDEPRDSRVVRLSDPEMEPALQKLKDRIKSDPAYAQALLERAGIVDAKGNLTERFGG